MMYRNYLLDTNILGHMADLRAGGNSSAAQALDRHLKALPEGTKLHLCPVSVGEVEYGLRIAPYKDQKKHDQARSILSAFECLPIDINTAQDQYAELRARLFNECAPKEKRNRENDKKRVEEWMDPTTSKQLQIQENDLWIAAVAMAYNLILVTDDKMAVIKRIAGIDITFENWLI
ncbi:MAG: type II toxin-antitoxin system VapC family toxin [Nitrospirae bacterium]|nr:type II toxin-antitoxin system VapC family toxin [Nitrospirota bacterium]